MFDLGLLAIGFVMLVTLVILLLPEIILSLGYICATLMAGALIVFLVLVSFADGNGLWLWAIVALPILFAIVIRVRDRRSEKGERDPYLP